MTMYYSLMLQMNLKKVNTKPFIRCLQAVAQRLKEIDEEIAEVDRELEKYFKELGV